MARAGSHSSDSLRHTPPGFPPDYRLAIPSVASLGPPPGFLLVVPQRGGELPGGATGASLVSHTESISFTDCLSFQVPGAGGAADADGS